ncbi:hypothetical protein GBAR_LOCUS23629, partial [Geodia barretti]
MYKCSNTVYRERLALLGVNCDHDVETVHPQYFCNQCYRSAERQHTSPGSTQIVWTEHSESSCEVCQHFRSLQRPGRKPSKRGRPPTDGKRILGNHIRRLMPPSERPEQYDLGKLPVPQSSVTCSLCDQIL